VQGIGTASKNKSQQNDAGRRCRRANLDEEKEIWVLALRGGTLALFDVMPRNVDTLFDIVNTALAVEPHNELTILETLPKRGFGRRWLVRSVGRWELIKVRVRRQNCTAR
jgi:hypothetical protein